MTDRPDWDGLRAKVLAVFDKVIVDTAGVINAPQLTDEICRIVKRRSSSVLTEDDGSGDPLPQGAMPPADGVPWPEDKLTKWARGWHWDDCAEEHKDPSIYGRDIRMLKAFRAALSIQPAIDKTKLYTVLSKSIPADMIDGIWQELNQ